MSDPASKIIALANKRAHEWFIAQCHNPFERFYLFHRQGDFRIAMDQPTGYTLSHPERISTAWTHEKATIWIIDQARRLPILPLDH